MDKKTVEVVAALIENDENEILCSLRSSSMSLASMWEFPGGKVEDGETVFEAIERELKEELKCMTQATKIIGKNTHEYENIIVNLTLIQCRLICGEPIKTEHASLIYLKREYLKSLVWAPADLALVDLVVNSEI